MHFNQVLFNVRHVFEPHKILIQEHGIKGATKMVNLQQNRVIKNLEVGIDIKSKETSS